MATGKPGKVRWESHITAYVQATSTPPGRERTGQTEELMMETHTRVYEDGSWEITVSDPTKPEPQEFSGDIETPALIDDGATVHSFAVPGMSPIIHKTRGTYIAILVPGAPNPKSE